MRNIWGVNLSNKCAGLLERACALTPALAAQGWASMDSAPKDGTEVELRLVHINAAFDEIIDKAENDGWIATARGHWIDHNGGGWTWSGLCGLPCQWRPAPPEGK